MTTVAVIGAGLAGASAAWRLAQGGHDVVVLEQETPAHRRGSSHGSARIFRYAYAERFYVDLVQRAALGWQELEAAHGLPLMTRTGALDHGTAHDPEGFALVLAEAGVEHELLSPDAATMRWGLPFETPVLWHPDAGVLDPEGTVRAMLAQAVSCGAEILQGWSVSRMHRTRGGYHLIAADGRSLEAEQVVVAAGGWFPDLLERIDLPGRLLGALPPVEVTQEQAYHFPVTDGAEGPRPWPTIIHKTDGMVAYALPGGRDAAVAGTKAGMKVAEYLGGKRLRSAAGQDGVIDQLNRQRVVRYVERHLPGLVPEPYAETTCLFTSTASGDFVIDRADGVTVLSPCSGHGAKFAPLLGELALALVNGDDAVPHRFRPTPA